jgi:hypothetical protein
MAESMTVTWSWEALGQVSLADSMLTFPLAPPSPGVYRLTFRDAKAVLTGVYVDETDRIPRRFQHYRTPGSDERLTMYRLNQAMVRALTQGGQIGVDVITTVYAAAGGGSPMLLDLRWKAARVLLERAVEVAERRSGRPMLNK